MIIHMVYIRTGKGNPFFGKHHTAETKKKLREIRMSQVSWNWKGDEVGKVALHAWVRKRLPKPKVCVRCKVKPPLDLANVSQEYKRDLSDWEWLCRSCHVRGDGRIDIVRNNVRYERTEEHKKKMSSILKGRVLSEEHKRKLSESAKRRHARALVT